MEDKYLSYKATDFALDDGFIKWTKKSSKKMDEQWSKWITKNPHMLAEINAGKEIINSLNIKNIDTGSSKKDTWSRIQQTIDQTKTIQSRKPSRRRILSMVSLAAACLALFVVFRYSGLFDKKIITGSNEQMAWVLPDKSVININDGSSIQYNANRFTKNRKINLKGEAFFEVEKGNPFIVSTPQGSIEVLGTSFNVFSRQHGFEVRCYTGRVRVIANGYETLLRPGQFFNPHFTASQDTLGQFDTLKYQDWRQGQFDFQEVNLGAVIAELERQYDVKVQLENGLEDIKYTGFFMDTDLKKALHYICWPLKLNSEINKNKISINRNF